MPYAPKYISQTDVENQVSRPVLVQVCDDDGDGAPDAAVIASFIELAEGLVDSWIDGVLNLPVAEPTDRLIRTAAILYVKALIFERHEEYVRSQQAERVFQRAERIGKQIRESTRRLPDVKAQPANVGGDVTSMEADLHFPCPPKPIFGGGTGDY